MVNVNVVICRECRQKTNLNNVRYAKNGRDLLCIPCSQRIEAAPKKLVASKHSYLCLHCNYKFSRASASKTTKRCPYCSSENIELHKSVTAPRILQEVADNPQFAYPN
jgi:DNA-directed RNA polymerase subunit RPC12/RpoP